MDWISFALGALVGAFTMLGIMAVMGWRWARPFMRAAQQRAATPSTPPDTTTNAPPTDWASWRSTRGN